MIGGEPGTPMSIRTLLKKHYPAAKTDVDRCCWAHCQRPLLREYAPTQRPPAVCREVMRGAIGEADVSLPVQVWSVQSLASRTGASLAGVAATRRSKRRQRLAGVWDRPPKEACCGG